MRLSVRLGIAAICALAAISLSAPQTKSVNDGVYTTQQATRGQSVYSDRCSLCHANNLAGRLGPPLAGNDFNATWASRPLLELAYKIRRTMPKNDATGLTDQESVDLLAYMLQTGKFPAGNTELTMNEDALKQVIFPGQAAAALQPSTVSALPPAGNVAQVMRGILFPSSNIIFTTQTIDPGAKKATSDSATVGMDWLTWGGGIYSGWEVVDYASIAVAESAQLMLTPGRRCENGRPAPVNDSDWIKFTNELAEAGKAAFKASQTRTQETISESTNQLNESCMHCHGMFRGRVHCAKP